MALELDDDELSRFLSGPYRSILRAVVLVTGDVPSAQDAVHEAIARAWERRRDIQSLDRWVVTTALNLARSRHRKLRREAFAPIPDRAGAAIDEVAVDFERAIAALPSRQREVVVLHYLLDLPVAEVALVLGLSEGGAKHALFRARASLAPALVETPEVER